MKLFSNQFTHGLSILIVVKLHRSNLFKITIFTTFCIWLHCFLRNYGKVKLFRHCFSHMWKKPSWWETDIINLLLYCKTQFWFAMKFLLSFLIGLHNGWIHIIVVFNLCKLLNHKKNSSKMKRSSSDTIQLFGLSFAKAMIISQ